MGKMGRKNWFGTIVVIAFLVLFLVGITQCTSSLPHKRTQIFFAGNYIDVFIVNETTMIDLNGTEYTNITGEWKPFKTYKGLMTEELPKVVIVCNSLTNETTECVIQKNIVSDIVIPETKLCLRPLSKCINDMLEYANCTDAEFDVTKDGGLQAICE